MTTSRPSRSWTTGAPETATWPAPAAALAAGRALFRAHCGGRVVVACDSDVDGLAAALVVEAAVVSCGGDVVVVVARRGEHVHTPSMQRRIEEAGADLLVVVDMGSRSGAIVKGLPTLLIDHHAPRGFPDGAVVVSAHGCAPVATSGLLAWLLLSPLADLSRVGFLAALSVFADLGDASAFAFLDDVVALQKKTHLQQAVSLLNAARRAGTFHGEVALDVLRHAPSARAIATGAVAGCDVLARCRHEVQQELARVSKTRPVIGLHGGRRAALVRFSSKAQVHPLVATRWAGSRLRGHIVVAANDGYLDGVVAFAVRCSDPAVDLTAFLRGLPCAPSLRGEFGNGHARASGGRLPPGEFLRFLADLGLAPDPRPPLTA